MCDDGRHWKRLNWDIIHVFYSLLLLNHLFINISLLLYLFYFLSAPLWLPVMCQDCCTSSHPPDLSDRRPVRRVSQTRVPSGPGTGTGHHPVSLQAIVFPLICRVRSHWLHASHPRILPSLHGMKKNTLGLLHCTDTMFLRPKGNETVFMISDQSRTDNDHNLKCKI